MSDLELLLRSPPGGRAPAANGSLVRDLTEADLHALHTAKLNVPPKLISRIRNTHHALARLVAAGVRNEEISRITGFSPSWISTLSNQDPAFKNLVEYYREQVASEFSEVHISLHERLTSVAMLAAEELQERLTNEPESLSPGELNDLVKSAADRTGFGPQTKSTNVNVNIDLAERLEAARKRAFGPTERYGANGTLSVSGPNTQPVIEHIPSPRDLSAPTQASPEPTGPLEGAPTERSNGTLSSGAQAQTSTRGRT